MTRIISMDGDHSTDEVIDWINYFDGEFTRTNIVKDIESEEFNFFKSNLKKASKKKSKGWIRKLGMFKSLTSYKDFLFNEPFELTHYLSAELASFRMLFQDEDIDWLCSPKSLKVSKLDMLEYAIKHQVRIPETILTNSKKSLKTFFNKHNGKIIIKSLTDTPALTKEGKKFYPLTMSINEEEINELPPIFYPSLLQEQIEKEFEIRSFYIKGKFYSAAIFSQTDNQTSLDFRNYNYKKPNRLVPYKLPKSIEKKLDGVCKSCNINTGSLDLIFTKTGEYYFLEINQSGQFGMISKPCNYNLEKIVAEAII